MFAQKRGTSVDLRIYAVAGVGGMAVLAAGPTQASGGGCDATALTTSFRGGSDSARVQTVSHLRAIAAGEAPASGQTLTCLLMKLRANYASRAGRQQALTDLGSTVTGGAGIVAAFAEGAGAATQGYWAAGALLPVLVSRFNANEPTRDLFHGAGQGLDFQRARYGEIRVSSKMLMRSMTGQESVTTWSNGIWTSGLPTATPSDVCKTLNDRMAHIENQGPDAAKVEARRILAACASAAVARSSLVVFAQAASSAQGRIDALEAADALKLEAAILQRDHDLRYSPLETFTALAAAPFEAASALLSGENGREALEALKTQAAFRGLDLTLEEFDLPAPPAPLAEVLVTDASAAAHPEIRAAANALNESLPAYNRAIALAGRMARAAKANRLKFEYDATTRAIMVALATA